MISVEGLNVIPVANFHDIQLRMKEGERQRTIAATKMNETSRFVPIYNHFFSKICSANTNLRFIARRDIRI